MLNLLIKTVNLYSNFKFFSLEIFVCFDLCRVWKALNDHKKLILKNKNTL